MPLQFLDSLDVYYGSSKRTLELYSGDLTNLNPDEAVDYLAVSALPGDYSPSGGSMIGALYSKGVSVQSLSANKAANYEPKMPCWISQPVGRPNPGIQFNRIVLFEPAQPQTNATGLVESIFRAVKCFQNGAGGATLATPLLCTGSGGCADDKMLTALFYAAVHWGAMSFPFTRIKIAIYKQDTVQNLRNVFAALKSNYLNLDSLNLPGGYSSYAAQAKSRISGMQLPSYLTYRQAFGICVYTSNYYGTINSVLRGNNPNDPTYIALMPLFEAIDTGLANIPPYVGMTYRGEGSMTPERLAQYQPGNDITNLAYTSTAYAMGGWYSQNYRFNINCITGCVVESYSIFSGEQEVLYGRNMINHVNTRDNSQGYYVFGIGERVINWCTP